MGAMPLAGDYLLKSELGKEKHYPLNIFFCNNCSLVQVLHVVKPQVLFEDYRYLSSVGLSRHFDEYAKELAKHILKRGSFVCEIGSNDGVLLLPLRKRKFKVLGIDPAKNVVRIAKKKGIETEVAYFGKKVAKKIIKKNGKADAILANNVLAHIDDLEDVFEGIRILLKPEGMLVFEVHYFPELIRKTQYDCFYNEHLGYYSLTSIDHLLSKYSFEIVDVKNIPIHAGSIRVYAKLENKGLKVKKSVSKMLEKENKLGVTTLEYVKNFARNAQENKKSLNRMLNKLKSQGERIVGYGAAGRGNIMLNYCGIGTDLLDYIVDESPERQGRYTPGTHIPIVNPEEFRKDDVKYALLFAWSYQEQILRKERKFLKKGGKFILPLPKVRIYP
jgi:SAM-dependent methyltransferase